MFHIHKRGYPGICFSIFFSNSTFLAPKNAIYVKETLSTRNRGCHLTRDNKPSFPMEIALDFSFRAQTIAFINNGRFAL